MAMIETKEKHTSSKSLRTRFCSVVDATFGDWVGKVDVEVPFTNEIKGSLARTLAALKIKAKANVTCMIKSYILQYFA